MTSVYTLGVYSEQAHQSFQEMRASNLPYLFHLIDKHGRQGQSSLHPFPTFVVQRQDFLKLLPNLNAEFLSSLQVFHLLRG